MPVVDDEELLPAEGMRDAEEGRVDETCGDTCERALRWHVATRPAWVDRNRAVAEVRDDELVVHDVEGDTRRSVESGRRAGERARRRSITGRRTWVGRDGVAEIVRNEELLV